MDECVRPSVRAGRMIPVSVTVECVPRGAKTVLVGDEREGGWRPIAQGGPLCSFWWDEHDEGGRGVREGGWRGGWSRRGEGGVVREERRGGDWRRGGGGEEAEERRKWEERRPEERSRREEEEEEGLRVGFSSLGGVVAAEGCQTGRRGLDRSVSASQPASQPSGVVAAGLAR